jgi:steroid Delta-isomerase
MEASAKVAMVHKYVEAFDKQDMDIIREIYSQDARVEDPVGTYTSVLMQSALSTKAP